MQYYSCVCILGHAQPRIGQLILAVEGVVFHCISGWSVLFGIWDSYYIFWQFILIFLFSIAKLKIKKKKADSYFPIFWVGRKRANKHLFLGLMYWGMNTKLRNNGMCPPQKKVTSDLWSNAKLANIFALIGNTTFKLLHINYSFNLLQCTKLNQ